MAVQSNKTKVTINIEDEFLEKIICALEGINQSMSEISRKLDGIKISNGSSANSEIKPAFHSEEEKFEKEKYKLEQIMPPLDNIRSIDFGE